MFDTMRIRTKLAVALLIPLLAVVSLSVVAVQSAAKEADEALTRQTDMSEQVALATSAIGPAGVATAISNERNDESILMLGLQGAVARQLGPNGEEPRAFTDKSIADFKAFIAAKPDSVQKAFVPAMVAMDAVKELRARTDAYAGPRSISAPEAALANQKIFDGYSDIIAKVFDANARVAQSIDDASLRTGATLADLSARQTEATSLVYRDLAAPLLAGTTVSSDPALQIAVAQRQSSVVDLRDQMRRSATGSYASMVSAALDEPALADNDQQIDDALFGRQNDVLAIIQKASNARGLQELPKLIAQQLGTDAQAVQTATDQQVSDAQSRQRTILLLTAGVLLLGVAVTLVASRSITRPLHRLTVDAENMASTRLPETVQGILDTPMGEDVSLPALAEIDKSGGYEIAEVATALNVVQKSAAELAVEQAVLRRNIADSFVNLGRRNQNLLSRQLDSITDMERSETDPDELQKLFTLDHLATRMRRNAESLLLLAGLEPHRQWSAPVAIVDVLRGALGEVEDYQRVSIRKLDAAAVKGKAAADVTHLIAELLENALRYSPGDVEIVGRQMGEGYTLAIIDNGVGIEADEMAQANIRLAGAESFTVAPSKYLGHYVVGRQAIRLDVRVRLSDSPRGGVTATIELGSIVSTDETTQLQAEPEFTAEALVPDRFQRDPEVTTDIDETSEIEREIEIAWGFDDDREDGDAERHEAATTLADALPAAPETAEAAEAEVAKTASGYTKRVRGAQSPSNDVLAVRQAEGQEAARFGGAAGVRNALSGLQAGRQKAQDETSNTDDVEEGR